MAVIELDTGPAPATTSRPPIHIFRPIALIAAVVLLLALGGAAPITAVRWQPLGSIPLPVDGSVTIAADRIVTVGDGIDSREVGVWRADGRKRLWSTTVDLAARDDQAVVTGGGRVVVAGGTVLVTRPDYRTTGLDLRTGRELFVAPYRIETVTPAAGLARETVFRPGTEYDQSSGDAGPLYLSADGRPYRAPPESTALIGVDLTSGRELWRRPINGWGFTVVVGDTLVVVSADRVQVFDPATGRVLRERASGGTWAEVFGPTLVVQEDKRTVGYDLATLTERWSSPVRLLADTITGARCDGVICRRGRDSVEVIDPATNTTTWQAGREVSLRREGDQIIEYDSFSQRPLRLNDARTGRTLADLRGWQSISPVGTGEPLLSRVEPGGRGMAFAVVRAGRIQPLGYADSVVRDCRTAGGLAACRTEDRVDLFAYR